MNKSNAANVLLLTEPLGKVNYPAQFLYTMLGSMADGSPESVFSHPRNGFS
jgi:hypothetical protein